MYVTKFFDVIIGFDFHVVLTISPAGFPVPTLAPHPFAGMVFDLGYYTRMVRPPWLEAFLKPVVLVNGVPRAQLGTPGRAIVPHFPIIGPFLVKPANIAEVLFASSTVSVEDEPMAYGPLPILTCQDIGLPSKKGKQGRPQSLMLPTSMVLPIPFGGQVFIGGSPVLLTNKSARRVAKKVWPWLRKALEKARSGRRVTRHPVL